MITSDQPMQSLPQHLRVFPTTPTRQERGTAPKFSVVIPCFNEEQAILETLVGIREHLRDAGPYELIVVDDGSTDGTSELLRQAAQKDPNLRVLTHRENQGYGASLKSGIRIAQAELIVITDADGTYPNEEIPRLVSLASRYDMIVGSRTAPTAQYPFLRSIPKVFLRRYASWITGKRIPDLNSGLRVFRRDLAQQFFHLISDSFSFTTTITMAMLSNRFQVHYEPIGYAPRVGRSKIRPIRDTLAFCRLVLRMGLYFNPLRTLLPLLAFIFCLFATSVSYDVAVLGNLTDKTVILLMFSMNFMLLSFMAEVINLANRRVVLTESVYLQMAASQMPTSAGETPLKEPIPAAEAEGTNRRSVA